MGYSIVENNAIAFADSKSIKFPRFQRKQTWNEKDNFKLCISVFKDYPIGVVIINSQDGIDFLLDGRQRRNALKLMKDDPKSVYTWAKSFVGFSPNQDAEELKEKFWISIDEYLQHEAANNKEQEDNNEETDDEITVETAENAYNFEKQYNSLKALLDLILICHPMKSNKTNLEKMYEFSGIIEKSELDYAEPIDGEYVINSIKLKKYIDSLNENEEMNDDIFISIIAKRYRITDQKLVKLSTYIKQHWEFYKKSLEVVESINRVLGRAKIGSVTLTNADVLDAQNIFSLVNHSGTPLSAEELLSARPFWNISLINPSSELIEYKKEMYKFLGINLPNETCRWDLCSTFLKRIDKHGLIFENEKNSFTTSISLSYRIISAIIVKGINNTSVTMLEKKKEIDWEVDIEKLIKDINFVIDLLEDINYFKHILAWRQSVMSLTSNSIAIEFCALMYKTWQDLNKPTKSSSNIKVFNKRAICLFDRLVYEYEMRMWTGSGDSLVASHLKDDSSRYNMVSEKEWGDFIEAICSGNYKGKPTSSKTLKPFLYNYYFLRELNPTFLNENTKYEIDHLVAQKFFKDNDTIDQSYKDNFVNFSILPKGENIEKTDKHLNEIHDTWLLNQIKKFADITDDDIELFSDLTNVPKLMKRKETYLKAYGETRNRLFVNL